MIILPYIKKDAAQARLEEPAPEPLDNAARLRRFDDMVEADRIIELDFPVRPEVRFGWDKPAHPRLSAIISAGDYHYISELKRFARFTPAFHWIKAVDDDPRQPSWVNDFIPIGDAISIYSYLALNNPKHFVEIGSGNSTKFARRAIKDHGLRTKIISIDPYPRAECDEICDQIIREPVERVNLSLFETLTREDMVFCDNSHRSFQNSDVTVFFLDILPALPKHMPIGIHDIFLPHDYPAHWKKRFYNEQYLLACYLLGGAPLRIDLPVFHIQRTPELRAHFDPLWDHACFGTGLRTGGCFWMKKT